jgi:hypothetical protein
LAGTATPSTDGGVDTGDAGTCVDPVTGLAASCESLGAPALAASDGSASGPSSDGSQQASSSRVTAKNPQTVAGSSRPTSTQILWWLLQGASVCALGVALAGARRRLA